MRRGLSLLLISSCLIGASCTGTNHFQVRAIPVPGATTKTGNALLAEARGQFALGNVGLALESFQTALREQPDSAEAYEGIAQCYAAMGRFDIARTNLEFALAYAPTDPRLLTEMAVALDKLGDHQRATETLAEATRVLSPPVAKAPRDEVTPIGVARTGSVTVKLPEISEQAAIDRLNAKWRSQIAISSRALATVPLTLKDEAVVIDRDPASAPVAVALRAVPSISKNEKNGIPATAPTPKPSLSSIPKRPIELPATEQLLAEDVRPHVPSSAITAPTALRGPYLERASGGEVELITAPRIDAVALNKEPTRAKAPGRSSPLAPAGERPKLLAEASVRWIPLKAPEQQTVELLNAARRHGLARQARAELASRGLRKIAIGDAREVRTRSLILYGKGRLELAHRLAAQFRCKTKKVAGLKTIIVLLGRDSIHRQQSARA